MFHHSITNHEPISSNYQNQRENYQLYAFSKKKIKTFLMHLIKFN